MSLPLNLPKLLDLAEVRSAIEVAIVCGPETDALADSIERLLADTEGFICARFEFRPSSGIKPCGHRDPDVVIVTLGASSANNLEFLFTSLQRAFPHRSVLVTTAQPDAFDIFEMLEMGASDFLLPPVRRSELVTRLMRQARVKHRGDALVQELKEKIGLKQIIGESQVFLREVQRIPRFAQSDATVLISGESGTGKEIFARATHYLSPRADRPFVPLNCGALPEHLVESEIFGHKRGAFTGAATDQPGLIHEAEGGTLFLDEVDALTAAAQVKLLRFLQDGEYKTLSRFNGLIRKRP